ncbi:innexin unc-9-like X3, partial [Biomphalaria pfeifferi]
EVRAADVGWRKRNSANRSKAAPVYQPIKGLRISLESWVAFMEVDENTSKGRASQSPACWGGHASFVG